MDGCEDNSGMTMQLGTTTISLPALTPNCPFGEGDNLEATGGSERSVEQTATRYTSGRQTLWFFT